MAFYLGWHPPKNQHLLNLIYIVAFLSVDVKSAVWIPGGSLQGNGSLATEEKKDEMKVLQIVIKKY